MTRVRALALAAPLLLAAPALGSSAPGAASSKTAPQDRCASIAAIQAVPDLQAAYLVRHVDGTRVTWHYKVTNVGCKTAFAVKVKRRYVVLFQGKAYFHPSQQDLDDLGPGQQGAVAVLCAPQGGRVCSKSYIEVSTLTPELNTSNNSAKSP